MMLKKAGDVILFQHLNNQSERIEVICHILQRQNKAERLSQSCSDCEKENLIKS